MRGGDLGVRRAGCHPSSAISAAPFLSLGSCLPTCPMRALAAMTPKGLSQLGQATLRDTPDTKVPILSGICTPQEQLPSLPAPIPFSPQSTKAAHRFPSHQPSACPVPGTRCVVNNSELDE